METPVLDQTWVDQTTVKSSIQLDFLLSEYKKQKDEGVKVSRMLHRLVLIYCLAGTHTQDWRCISLYFIFSC